MSYSAMRPDGVAVYPASQAPTSERLTFIRKVYLMMFSGILAYATISGALTFGALAHNPIPGLSTLGMLSMNIPPLVALLLIVGASIGAHAISMVKGLNLVGFYGFAAVFGILSVNLFAYAMVVAGSAVIFQALGLTVLVFGGLSAYVLITKKDFNFIGGFLMVGMFLLLGAVVVAIVMQMMGMQVRMLSIGLAIFSTLLFAGYVLYDTSNMLHRYSTDMVVPAALALMIAFIMLFRNILYLLMASRN